MDVDKYDSKIYCCSNGTRSEAKKLAIFDIVGSLLALIFATWTTEMVKHHAEYFRNITEPTNATLTDLKFLLDLETREQDFCLAGILVWCGWSMVLGGTLFYAAQMMRHGLLRIWFGITLLNILMGLFLVVLALLYFERKIAIGAICIMVYLYKWYEAWIILRLVKEARSGSAIFDSGDGKPAPSLVVVSPTPDPDTVYTIQGDNSSNSGSNHKSSNDKDNGTPHRPTEGENS